MPVSVPTSAEFLAAVALLTDRVVALEAHLDLPAEPDPAPEPDPTDPAPESDLTAPQDLTATAVVVGGDHFVDLTWSGVDAIHLCGDDYDGTTLVRTTDQGVVTGGASRRGPMGQTSWTYRFWALVGETRYDFPAVAFAVDTAPGPEPSPEPTPNPSPPPAGRRDLVAAVLFDTDAMVGLNEGDSGIRQWSQDGPNTFKVVEHLGQTWGRARITGGPHDRDIRAEGIVVALGTDSTLKLRPGDEYWFGDTIVIGEGFPAQHFNNVLQWKNDGRGSAPMYFGAWDDAMQLRSSFGNRAVGAIDFGRPHRYVFGVLFDSDGDGWVEVWRDGERMLKRTPASTLHSGKESYPKVGYYRGDEIVGDGAVYHCDYRIGRSRAAVE